MKNTRKGWFERKQPIFTKQGIQNKALVHRMVAVKKGMETTLRVPMVKANERKPWGYWAHENTLKELKEVKAGLGHFPHSKELYAMGLSGLCVAITQNGGSNKFRKLLGDEITKVSDGYWTEETIIEALKTIKDELGQFPLQKELERMGRTDVSYAIFKHGGFNKFRKLLGDEIIKVSTNHWTNKTTLEELKIIKRKLGHFPERDELKALGRSDLEHAMSKNGGSNKFRKLLGDEIIQASPRYWTHEITLKELNKIEGELGHFPMDKELRAMGRGDLTHAISINGGVDKFRKLLGYPLSLEESSGRNAYTRRRGYKSEKEVKKILINYCKRNGRPEPTYNKKLSIGNVIEFVCGGTIGIDVTNTRSRNGCVIRHKYIDKDYYKYLDKLWIVVLSDVFTTEDYIRFNEESPNNVEIMSVWDLIDTLQVDIDEHSRRKLSALETCTLRTKNDLINSLKNRNLGEYT